MMMNMKMMMMMMINVIIDQADLVLQLFIKIESKRSCNPALKMTMIMMVIMMIMIKIIRMIRCCNFSSRLNADIRVILL